MRTGGWQLVQNASAGVDLALLAKAAGKVVLQVTATGTSVAGLHDVQVLPLLLRACTARVGC